MATEVLKATSFEDILNLVGTRGRLNYCIFFAACIGAFTTALHTFAYQFLGATPSYWCHIEELHKANWTSEQIKDVAIPFQIREDGGRNYDGCTKKDLNYSELSRFSYEEAKHNEERFIISRNDIACPSRDFEDHAETIVNKWDLVCNRRALYSTTQAAIQGGMFLGALIIGYLTDRFGRFFMYKLCVTLYVIVGFATALSPNIEVFIVFKVLTAMLGHGYYMAGFLLSMEFCTPSQRSCVSSYYVMPWAFGIMILPGIAYLVPTWYWLEVALTVPALVLFINFWVLLESPRWLILNKRYDEAGTILLKLAESNKRIIPSQSHMIKLMESLKIGDKEDLTEDKGFLQRISELTSVIFILVTKRKYRLKTLAVFFCWFAVAMVYYGISVNSVSLSTNEYLYMFLGGVTEIPSYVLLWPAVVFLGRKKTFISLYLICGISLLLVLAIITNFSEDFYPTVKLILFLMGKFSVTAAFHLAFVYTAELYPTQYRSLVVGEANAVGRLGGICSPYINDMLGLIATWIPAALFGTVSIAAGLVALVFPETTGINLPEIVREPTIKNQIGLQDESFKSPCAEDEENEKL